MAPDDSLAPIHEDNNSRRFARMYDSANARSERKLETVRRELFRHVTGNALEIGPGTGINVQHYDVAGTVTLLEPYREMRKILSQRVEGSKSPEQFSIVDGRSEEIPASSNSMDTVVSTLVLCSVPDLTRTLAEIQRVLKPEGNLVFLEHHVGTGLRSRVQHALTPFMKKYGANCHLDRDTPSALSNAGFILSQSVPVPSDISLRILPNWPMSAGSAAIA